jgi:hypothetical protein
LPSVDREKLLREVVELYRDDPDSGVHSACRWLLAERLLRPDLVQKINKEITSDEPIGDRRWFHSKFGFDMAVVEASIDVGAKANAASAIVKQPQNLKRYRYAISTTEVSIDQVAILFPKYRARVGALNGSTAAMLSFEHALQYCNEMSKCSETQICYPQMPTPKESKEPAHLPADYLERNGYRLPTPAEWMTACRGGSITIRFFGDDEALAGSFAWLDVNAHGDVQPVAKLLPNRAGLFDVYGNALDAALDFHESLAPSAFSYPVLLRLFGGTSNLPARTAISTPGIPAPFVYNNGTPIGLRVVRVMKTKR